jgi:hypothetical protein
MLRIAPTAVACSASSVENESLPMALSWVLLRRCHSACRIGKGAGLLASRIAPRRDARCDAETVLRSLLIGSESEVRQRVVGMLGRAAAAEFGVPGERRRIHPRVERRRHGVAEPREHIDAVDVRDQHQRIVPERQVMAAIVEDVERDLGRRRGIDAHGPISGDREEGNGIAVTVARTTRKRAMVRLCGRGLRRTR